MYYGNQILRTLLAIFLALAVCCLTGCGGDSTSTATSTSPSTDMPDDPINDEIYGATSTDMRTFEVLSGPFFFHAGLPDIFELQIACPLGQAGTMVAYFTDLTGATGPASEEISVSTSTDGITWTSPTTVNVSGELNSGSNLAPTAVQLSDGRIRLYYYGADYTTGDPADNSGDHKIYSAISTDGVNFTVELDPDVCFQMPEIIDPEIVQVGSSWWLFLGRDTETLLATSTDGRTFTKNDTFNCPYGAVPGALALPDGNVRLYLLGEDGIISVFVDAQTFAATKETGTVIPPLTGYLQGDPNVTRRSDGSYYMLFKRREL